MARGNMFQQVGKGHCQGMMGILYKPPDNFFTSLPGMNSLHNRYRQGCLGTEQSIDTQLPTMPRGSPLYEYASISEDIGSLDILSSPSTLCQPLAQVARHQVNYCCCFLAYAQELCQQRIRLEDTAIERLPNRFQHA